METKLDENLKTSENSESEVTITPLEKPPLGLFVKLFIHNERAIIKNQISQLKYVRTVYDTIADKCSHKNDAEIREFLGESSELIIAYDKYHNKPEQTENTEEVKANEPNDTESNGTV